MTEGLKGILKKWGVYLGSLSGLIAAVAIIVGLYTLQSDVANLKRNDHKQDLMINDAINAAHEKELQCQDMIHHFNMIKSKYEYCS